MKNKTSKFLAAVLLNLASDTNSSLVICTGNPMLVQGELAWMQVFTGQE